MSLFDATTTQTNGGGDPADLLSPLINNEVSISSATLLDAAAFGKLHNCSDASSYAVTLPVPAGNAGKWLGFRVTGVAGGAVTVAANNAETINSLTVDRIYRSGDGARYYCDGTNWLAEEQIADILLEDTTVHLDSSMSHAAIQAAIDAQPRNLGGKTLQFQLANGAYTLGSQLTFKGFFAGTVQLLGDVANNMGKSTSKNVVIDTSSSTDPTAFRFQSCACRCDIWALHVLVNSTSGSLGIYAGECQYVQINSCHASGNGTGNGHAINIVASAGDLVNTYVSNTKYGVSVYSAAVVRNVSSEDAGTMPAYGHYAYGSVIMRGTSLIDGSIADDLTANGGRIFT